MFRTLTLDGDHLPPVSERPRLESSMKRSWILVILCLALGAVRAGAQTQAPGVSLFTQPGPVVSGGNHPCLITLQNVAQGGDVWFLLGDPGAGTIVFYGHTFAVPLITPLMIHRQKVRGSFWYGRVRVPSHPSLIGWTPLMAAALVTAHGQFALSPLVPFGPIIEDSIQ